MKCLVRGASDRNFATFKERSLSSNAVILMVGFKLNMPKMSDTSWNKLMTIMAYLRQVKNVVCSAYAENSAIIVCDLLLKESDIP